MKLPKAELDEHIKNNPDTPHMFAGLGDDMDCNTTDNVIALDKLVCNETGVDVLVRDTS
jgi:hypothetical protein